jgi:hypothetical protein
MTRHKDTGQALADNLNRNVMLEHIEEVEKGNKPKDSDYLEFTAIRQHLSSLRAFQDWKYGKQKSNWKRTAVTVLGVALMFILAGGLFYWFEIRPANIRADCAESVRNPKYQTLEANCSYR